MAVHHLEPERRTLHANWSRDRAPALEIDSGDTVEFRALDVGWGIDPPTSTTAPRRKFEPRDPVHDAGPCLIGPVRVRGAAPGDTLEVRIDALEPGPWGWTYAGTGITPPRLARTLGTDDAPLTLVRWSIDRAAGIAKSKTGLAVPVRPFLGTIGIVPAGPGPHSGWVPTAQGGNMDCKELIAGTTLHLPVGTEGAMLSVGDGHAAQGDGEIGGTAIECRMDRAAITITLRKKAAITGPRIRAPDAWITLGFGPTVDEAMHAAARTMLELMEALLGVPRAEALALAGVCVDLRITQAVNPAVGVHAVLNDHALRASLSGRTTA
jgi:acetamidase/formamidase